jgi:hypothetical protein
MKNILKKALMTGLIVVMTGAIFAQQEKTADELKAEREQLKSELKSKDVEKRRKKLENLKEPGQVGVASVDELAESSTKLLIGTKDFNASVPELYKRTIGETVDGVTEVNVQKPTFEELTKVAMSITASISGVSKAQGAIQKASDDIKTAPKTSVLKATKSLNYSKDVLSLVLPELQLNAKVVANLIETLKTSENY